MDENAPYIIPHPFVVDAADESAPFFRADGIGHKCSSFGARGNDLSSRIGIFKNGKKLYEGGEGTQEAVDFNGVSCRAGIDGAKNVEFNAERSHHLGSMKHFVESSMPSLVLSESVVYLPRAIKGESYEKMVFAKKRAPLSVDERAVCLEGVFDLLVALVAFLQFHRFLEEGKSCKQGLASVPAERDDRRIDSLDVLSDVLFEKFFAHARHVVGVEVCLIQIVAVGTLQVTSRADRLHKCAEVFRADKFPRS